MATYSKGFDPTTGKLGSNEIFGALYNMIISQEVFADNIKGTDLVDQARVDGGLYSDTKLFYSTDALKSAEWGNDAEATNLLELHRPEKPECQAIVLNKFRQICLTVDDYLSKRAWADEGAFSSFNSVMTGWLSDTKKVYDGTTYNAYIGTAETSVGKQTETVTIAADDNAAQVIAEKLANIVTEMTDYTRDFNDYGQLRRHSESELKVIFNSKYINKIKNIDLPVIFDNAGLKATFAKEVLPARYFGTVVAEDVAQASKVPGKVYRALVEQSGSATLKHYFAGDVLDVADTAKANMSYIEDDKIICKIVTKLPPYMSAFQVGTSFFNAKSLTTNQYLTFGHNTIDYLKGYPLVTVKEN